MNIYNRPVTKANRRILRNNQTEAERDLWNILRNKQMGGYKFFRQYGIGYYIADFYCPSLKMVIEVDGGQHFSEEGIKHDHQREAFLKKMGIKVLRLNNMDVLRNMEGVFEYIQKELPLSPSLIASQRGGNLKE
ncbi:MAG: endonuclease domain-containing protein [Candidatus Omnitrophica bacterium]|nr:endonuclease domain-containing protein [Candidatus Omnitrophota bacterium]